MRPIRRAARMLSPVERQVVRDLWSEHLSIRAQILDVDRQLCDLMSRRDELSQRAAQTGLVALAEKMSVSQSHILYLCKPRGTQCVA